MHKLWHLNYSLHIIFYIESYQAVIWLSIRTCRRLRLSIFRIPVMVLITVVTYPTSGGSTTGHLERRGESTYIVLLKWRVGKHLVTALYYSQVILLFMCRQWTEAIMLFRYDFKNRDVKCTAVLLISLKWMKVSNRIQTVCHCQTVQWKYQTEHKQYVTVRLYNESTKQNTNSIWCFSDRAS